MTSHQHSVDVKQKVMSVFRILTACASLMIINLDMMVLKMAEVDPSQRLQRHLE